MIDQIKFFIHILCLTKLWLSDFNNHIYKIEGYISHFLVQANGGIKGINIYVLNTINCGEINKFFPSIFSETTEYLTVNIKIKKQHINIFAAYRPP